MFTSMGRGHTAWRGKVVQGKEPNYNAVKGGYINPKNTTLPSLARMIWSPHAFGRVEEKKGGE
jgi:hypothetical protein